MKLHASIMGGLAAAALTVAAGIGERRRPSPLTLR